MDNKTLKSIPLFSEFSREELLSVSQNLNEEKYRAGQIIYSPSEPSENLFILKSGQVIITHELEKDVITLARLPEGFFFGEGSILKNKAVHYTQARAEPDNTSVLMLSKTNFEKLKKQNPSAALKLIEKISLVISERLSEDMTRIATISAISDLITNPDSSREAGPMAEKILKITKTIIPARRALLGVYQTHDKSQLDVIASVGISPKHIPQSMPSDSDKYLRQIIQENKAIMVPSDRYESSGKVFYAAKNILGCPIVAEKENIGAMVLSDKEDGEFTNNNHLILSIIASQISFAIEEAKLKKNKSAQEELRRKYIEI